MRPLVTHIIAPLLRRARRPSRPRLAGGRVVAVAEEAAAAALEALCGAGCEPADMHSVGLGFRV